MTMTNQEIFDKVAVHLLTQGQRSRSRDAMPHLPGTLTEAAPRCRYRGDEGRMCAVGCLITRTGEDSMKHDEIKVGARLVRCEFPEREVLEEYGPHIEQDVYTVERVGVNEVMLVPDDARGRARTWHPREVCHHFQVPGSPEHAERLQHIHSQVLLNMADKVREIQARYGAWTKYKPEMEMP